MLRPEVTISRRVHWFDTDASTKEHNSAPLRWMEEAEAELLDRLGLVEELYGYMPRARVEIDYRRPVRFRDTLEITVRIEDVGTTSISYGFEVRTVAGIAVEGKVVAVHVDADARPSPWPERARALLSGESTGA